MNLNFDTGPNEPTINWGEVDPLDPYADGDVIDEPVVARAISQGFYVNDTLNGTLPSIDQVSQFALQETTGSQTISVAIVRSDKEVYIPNVYIFVNPEDVDVEDWSRDWKSREDYTPLPPVVDIEVDMEDAMIILMFEGTNDAYELSDEF